MSEIKQKIEEAREAYYGSDQPIMPDDEFDALEARARELGVDVDSVGGAKGVVPHSIPMLSLAKVTTEAEVLKFANGDLAGVPLLVQPKLDGVSMSLEYDDGSLVRAVTRGDGVTGEDVTHIADHILSIPPVLNDFFTGVVRGEVVIHRDELDPKFKNTRNAVSGCLNHRTKSPENAAKYKCRFYAFDAYDEEGNGFIPDDFESVLTVTPQADSLNWTIENIIENRLDLPYDIDGVVVKVKSHDLRTQLGNRSSSPRWAIAFKPQAETAVTKLLGVTWQTGAGGGITPVAELEPVDLCGVTISRASLHNIAQINKLGISIGDEVIVKRANEVIPQVVGVAVEGDDQMDIGAPDECPSCLSPLQARGNSGQIRCTNSDKCAAQIAGRLITWVSKGAADIDALGPVVLEKLIENGVKQPADLYGLVLKDLLALDGVEHKMATKILKNIKKSKDLGMRRAIIGLAISNVGAGTAKRLCEHYETALDALLFAEKSALTKIRDIGDTVADSIIEWGDTSADCLYDLEAWGVNLDRLPEDAPREAVAGAKSFVITGSVPGFKSRKGFSDLLSNEYGWKLLSGVNKDTDLLIINDTNSTSSKAKKARDLGIPMFTPAQVAESLQFELPEG